MPPAHEAPSFAVDSAPEQPPASTQEQPPAHEAVQKTEAKKEIPLPTEKQKKPEETIETLTQKLKKPRKQKPTTVPQIRDELTVRVEKIMEEGLADAYRELTPVQKQEFKLKGEQTAYAIRKLLGSARIRVRHIFTLLIEWLKLLPGVNRFFLEQEAKIKADKILTLHEHYGKRK